MAAVLICEPHPAVHALLAHVVRDLGHSPVAAARPSRTGIDAIVVEPADEASLAAARAARLANEHAGIVCVSIAPAARGGAELEPVAYLLKPFAIADLELALAAALGGAGEPPG